ncbi:hypothetical protein HHI36_000038 [Cryptolaemus montrouzieri]|uniref:DDE-1 domain-containing protein n=1 Tax=Cryptolaemus montrouzieri TaxID=559131 RepID=A0ABD2P483_9CUCU
MDLVPDRVYNADESGLFWRILPNKTLAAENSAPGRKMSKDRITFMPCSYASVSHKIKLLVIGKANIPRAFKNCSNLPVYYKGQRKEWVTRKLFYEWFHKQFIPDVKNKMNELKLPQKVLLLLDNVLGHPREEELISEDRNIQVMFLSHNCTPLK